MVIYLLLASTYFFIVPIFEGPDEWTHTGHVKFIAEGNGLPVMLPDQGIWGGQQPPLYYVGGALLMQWFDLAAFDEYDPGRLNPHASMGYALDPGNKNLYLHYPEEDFPYTGLSLAVHILRLYSMFFGGITLVFLYLTAYELQMGNHDFPSVFLFPSTIILMVATQPMFGFITAMVANEPANMAFCALVLWLSQRYVLHGATPSPWRAIALGLALGLVSLSKMTGLSVGLVAVIAFLITAIQEYKQPHVARRLWRDGVIIGLCFGLVGGWWYWRNYQLYGDFFQTGLYKIYFNDTPDPLNLSHFLYILRSGEVSFWATFGWLNIVAPAWVYMVYWVVSRIGLFGIGLQLIRNFPMGKFRGNLTKGVHRHETAIPYFPSALLLHIAFPLALAFSLTRLVAIEGGMQGRQLLPALGSIAILIVWGWYSLGHLISRKLGIENSNLGTVICNVPFLVCIILFLLALYLPLNVVYPAYTPTPTLTEAELPDNLVRLDWHYNDHLKLLGVEVGTQVAKPGDRIPVTAYWQHLQPTETNYSVFVHLFGRQHTPVGQMNSYPGLGLRPTSTLQADEIFADTYPVLVEGGTSAPTSLHINLGLFDFNEPGRPGIQAVDETGNLVGPAVGTLKLIPSDWPTLPSTKLAQFTDSIELRATEIKNCSQQTPHCSIHLTWQATGHPVTDYTVFIQLWRHETMIQGFDTPPLHGDYPTTLWAPNEIILDPHTLDLTSIPPGTYKIWVGLYNFQTGTRLPITAGEATISPHQAVQIGDITVTQ